MFAAFTTSGRIEILTVSKDLVSGRIEIIMISKDPVSSLSTV
jgi:hypothetical protein